MSEHESELIQRSRYSMDLCHAVPYFALKEAKRDKIWDDGLHLTEEGYKMMGAAIAAHLIKLLQSLGSVKNARSANAE